MRKTIFRLVVIQIAFFLNYRANATNQELELTAKDIEKRSELCWSS
jgi:hypothetical protein